MPEIRYTREFDIKGNELQPKPYEVSDEELAEETEGREIAQIINELKDTKLKKIFLRLREQGLLP